MSNHTTAKAENLMPLTALDDNTIKTNQYDYFMLALHDIRPYTVRVCESARSRTTCVWALQRSALADLQRNLWLFQNIYLCLFPDQPILILVKLEVSKKNDQYIINKIITITYMYADGKFKIHLTHYQCIINFHNTKFLW